jgi:hypothetical protein
MTHSERKMNLVFTSKCNHYFGATTLHMACVFFCSVPHAERAAELGKRREGVKVPLRADFNPPPGDRKWEQMDGTPTLPMICTHTCYMQKYIYYSEV